MCSGMTPRGVMMVSAGVCYFCRVCLWWFGSGLWVVWCVSGMLGVPVGRKKDSDHETRVETGGRAGCRGHVVFGGGLASAADGVGGASGGVSQCVPDKSTIAQCFPDKALAQDIARQLKGDANKTGEVLTSKDVDDVTSLDFRDSSVASVQGLQVFTNLEDLYLPGTKVSDVSALAKLTKLRYLYLSNTRVSDVSALAKLTKLKTLDLSGTRVSDATLASVAKLTNLNGLSLSGTRVSDVSPLAGLKGLSGLGLSDTKVSDAALASVAKLTTLWSLELSGTRVSDAALASVAKLPELDTLDLSKTQVSDVSALAKLTKLKTLDLSGTRVLNLRSLRGLPLSSNMYARTSEEETSFADVHPSMKLTVNSDGSVSMPAPRWIDGTVVAPSSTSPAGGTLDAKRGVVTWKKYDAKASYSYDFMRFFTVSDGSVQFSGHVAGVKPSTSGKPAVVSGVTMWRLYNPNSGEHFYTGNTAERDHLVHVGWKYEGVGWVAPAKSSTPVYRMYNPNAGDHHYTMNPAERDMLVRAGWKYEGVGWYSATNAGRAPVYREYNPNAKSGSHNYTLNWAEHKHLGAIGWSLEGVAWYAARG